jgi:hypothetical protein
MLEGADLVPKGIVLKEPTCMLLARVGEDLRNIRESAAATSLFVRARQAVEAMPEGRRAECQDGILWREAEHGNLAAQKAAIARMKTPHIALSALLHVATQQLEHHWRTEAQATLRQAARSLEWMTGNELALGSALWVYPLYNRTRGHAALAALQAEAGELVGAKQNIERAQRLGAEPLLLLKAHAKAGDFVAAKQILPTLKEAPQRSEALEIIATAQARAGEYSDAKHTALAITYAGGGISKARSLARIALAL